MKICLFGATGLLGSEFKKVFTAQNLNFVAPRSNEVSLLKHDKVLEYLKTQAPTLIVNCAAYTAVDKAEKESDICMKLNAEAVTNLTKAGIPLINFSTEYVFNAPAGIEIEEDYARDPQSVYAKSKLAGEEALEASKIDWWNIRTSWLWGPGGNNFVSTITRLSQKYDELKIIDDQIGRPTYAPELAEFVTEHFVVPILTPPEKGDLGGLKSKKQNPSQPPLLRGGAPTCGHYHLQNSGDPVSWAGFAQYFLNQQGWHGTTKKISTTEYGAPAARPKNSVLKNTKLKSSLSDWKEAVLTTP